jgi:hypothetical protein
LSFGQRGEENNLIVLTKKPRKKKTNNEVQMNALKVQAGE